MPTYSDRTGTVKGGWVKIWRQLFDNRDISTEPYCETAAWIWLIAHADFEPGPHRGTLWYSQRVLAEKWGWTREKVRWFLAKLADKKMIKLTTHRATHFCALITICNYEIFQEQQPSSQPSQQPTIKEGKKTKNRISPSNEGESRARKAKSALPENWQLPPEWRAWAEADNPGLAGRVSLEAAKFRDYWHAHGKRMVDWQATWRNWWRRSAELGPRYVPSNGAAPTESTLERYNRILRETPETEH